MFDRCIKASWIALPVMMAVLCVFLCWGVYRVVPESAAFLAQGAQSEAAIGAEAASAKTLTDNANDVVNQAKPQIAAATKNLVASTANLQSITANLKTASAGINVAVTEINRPCGAGDSCGTIADLNRTLHSLRLAAGQVTAISEGEKKQRLLMNDQETKIANDAQADLVKFGAAIDGITALSTNKDLTGTFTKLNATMGSLDGMAAETATAWHEFLHPKWPKRVESAVQNWGTVVGKFFVP